MDWFTHWDGLLLGAVAIGFALAASARKRETMRQLRAYDGEREALVATLRKRNALLELTEAVADIGHWRLDLADGSLFWSDNIFAIHGLPPGHPPSLKDAIAVYPPEDRQMVQDHVAHAQATGTPWLFEARLLRPDGLVRRVEARGHAERAADGRLVAMYGMLADRTEAIDLREKALAERDKAQAATRAKAEFLAHMSHELRTPMNAEPLAAESYQQATRPRRVVRQAVSPGKRISAPRAVR